MNILFYGGHYWDRGSWFRKQQFASRLSKKGHRVFYVESSVSILRKTKFDKNLYFKTKITKINDNLFIITPSTMLPFPNYYYLRFIFNLKLLRDFKKYLKKLELTEFIIWFNQVEFSSITKNLKQIKIFDLADDRPYYSILANDEKGYKTMLKYVELAFSNSDICMVSAQKIKEKYQKYAKSEIFVIPNGHNIKLNQNTNYEVPEDLKSIEGPIVGFIGTLFHFIDDKLLEYIISKRPNYNFVFVGPIQNNFPINKIKYFKNVYLLGEKLKTEIPNYINSFTVCLNPFKVHEVNDSVSPVKVFEYLALKKHVISTEMYSLRKEKISQYIVFAKSYEDYLANLDKLVINHQSQIRINDDILEEYSWDKLFLKLISTINDKFKLKL